MAGSHLFLRAVELQSRQFQSGDLKAQVWRRPSEIRSVLDDAIGLDLSVKLPPG